MGRYIDRWLIDSWDKIIVKICNIDELMNVKYNVIRNVYRYFNLDELELVKYNKLVIIYICIFIVSCIF